MKKKKRNISLLAGLLGLSLLLHGTIQAWEADRPCAVTFENGTLPDLDNANVVIDVYEVGNVVPDPSYDTYSFEVDPAFSALDLSTLDDETYTRAASNAMNIVLENEAIEPVAGIGMDEKLDLTNGLYLAVPHGKDLTDYTKQNMRGETYTLAQSPTKEYHFSPILFSLPTKENINGEISTGNGEWIYDSTITLKVEEEPRKGSLEIVKTLDRFDDNGPATFVFSIEAYEDESR